MIKRSIIVLLSLFSLSSWAESYDEGTHYQVLENPLPSLVADGKIYVEEIFWYGCPYCYQFQQNLTPWLETLGDDVVFEKRPADFNQTWASHAHFYYVVKSLGLESSLSQKIFEHYHVKRQTLINPLEQEQFVDAFSDKTKEDFRGVYYSFYVNTMLSSNSGRLEKMGLDGVPAMLVDGKYLINVQNNGLDGMLKVADYLIEKVRTERSEVIEQASK